MVGIPLTGLTPLHGCACSRFSSVLTLLCCSCACSRFSYVLTLLCCSWYECGSPMRRPRKVVGRSVNLRCLRRPREMVRFVVGGNVDHHCLRLIQGCYSCGFGVSTITAYGVPELYFVLRFWGVDHHCLRWHRAVDLEYLPSMFTLFQSYYSCWDVDHHCLLWYRAIIRDVVGTSFDHHC